MRSTLFKYGPRAFGVTVILFLFAFVLGGGQPYSIQEVLGYLSIVVSLSLVYFAIRHYRDEVNAGKLTVGQGLGLGMLLTVFVGLGAGGADIVYTTLIYPDFIEEYTQYELDRMKEDLPAAEYATASKELLAQIEWMGTPFMLAVVMFVTVVLIGFIVSLISSVLLRRGAR